VIIGPCTCNCHTFFLRALTQCVCVTFSLPPSWKLGFVRVSKRRCRC
jgi:hypothetical protein